jgi:hypothetical protein
VSETQLPFAGIFDPTVPGRGGQVSWQWRDFDLNLAATKMLTHVDRMLERFSDVDTVWLGTIELDVVPGRFPEVFAAFVSDPERDDSERFCVPEILDGSFGTLICELRVGRLKRLLEVDGGYRWGSALRVGAVQVPGASVDIALRGSLFDPGHASVVEKLAHCAWAASADLNSVAMWASMPDGTWRERVESLGGSSRV